MLLHGRLLLNHRSHLRDLIRHLLELGGLFQALPKLHLLLLVDWRWLLWLLLYISRGSKTSPDPHLRLLLLLLLMLLSIEINLRLLQLLGLLDQRILSLHRDLHGLPPHQILLSPHGVLKLLLLLGLLRNRIHFVHCGLLE